MMPKLALTAKPHDAERLGIEVMTSSRIMRRGSKFNAHVLLHNNFDRPIQVTGWSWQLPPGLVFPEKSPGNEDVLELQPGDSRSLVFIIKANGVLDFTIHYRTLF